MAFNMADLFEHTVDLVADREVLVVGDERRTYGQLEERANRLAHHLADGRAPRRVTTSGSTAPTAPSGSRARWPPTSSGPCR